MTPNEAKTHVEKVGGKEITLEWADLFVCFKADDGLYYEIARNEIKPYDGLTDLVHKSQTV